MPGIRTLGYASGPWESSRTSLDSVHARDLWRDQLKSTDEGLVGVNLDPHLIFQLYLQVSACLLYTSHLHLSNKYWFSNVSKGFPFSHNTIKAKKLILSQLHILLGCFQLRSYLFNLLAKVVWWSPQGTIFPITFTVHKIHGQANQRPKGVTFGWWNLIGRSWHHGGELLKLGPPPPWSPALKSSRCDCSGPPCPEENQNREKPTRTCCLKGIPWRSSGWILKIWKSYCARCHSFSFVFWKMPLKTMKKTELAHGTAAFLLTPAIKKKLILQILRSVLKACYLAINLSLAIGGLRGILSADGSWKSPVWSSIKFLTFWQKNNPIKIHQPGNQRIIMQTFCAGILGHHLFLTDCWIPYP